jgi:hypothetical protein
MYINVFDSLRRRFAAHALLLAVAMTASLLVPVR